MPTTPTPFANGIQVPYVYEKPMLFANLPSPTKTAGIFAFISDSPTTAAGAIVSVGGSTNKVAVYCDGTNWRVLGGVVGAGPNFTTSSVTTGIIAAGVITGNDAVWVQTGATPGTQTTRTAAQMLADTPNGRVGQTTRFRIVNTGSGALLLAADGSVTLNLSGGSASIAQNTWKDFLLTFNTASTATIQLVGTGTF